LYQHRQLAGNIRVAFVNCLLTFFIDFVNMNLKLYCGVASIFIMYSAFAQVSVVYPETIKRPVEEQFFDTLLVDDYRWLEDTRSPETVDWLREQKELSDKYLSRTRRKEHASYQLEELSAVRFNKPMKIGRFYYKMMYPSPSLPPALYYMTSIEGTPKMLINPDDISKKDIVQIRDFAPSGKSDKLAVMYSRNGSDWCEVKVKKINGKYYEDHIHNVKFSNLGWKGEGFFYQTYNRGGKFDQDYRPRIFYHRIGTQPGDDILVFEPADTTLTTISFQVTSNERYLLIYQEDRSDSKKTVFIQDLNKEPEQWAPALFVRNFISDLNILGEHNGDLIALTDHNLPYGGIVRISPEDPYNWKVISPGFSDAIITSVRLFRNQIVCELLSGPKCFIAFLDYEGNLVKSLSIDPGYSIQGFMGEMDDDRLVYSIGTYFLPPVVYTLDLKTYKSELVSYTEVNFDPHVFKIEISEYPSADGTMVPVTIVMNKKTRLNGNNLTLLKTYGGFGLIEKPVFDWGITHFLNNGGIFAYAHVRGSGQLGEAWAASGRNMNKAKSVDDFIAGAEYLIRQGYTSAEKLAITGVSNGGLIVAAAMIKRPDLFRVAVPVVGVYDMIRFQKFTVGGFHTKEYGSVENKEEFYNLLSYSPLHKIKSRTNYPATLIMTAENDDRVPPFHSYKFAARLQNNRGQLNPVLLRIEKKAGHYGATGYNATIAEYADMYSFILHHLKD